MRRSWRAVTDDLTAVWVPDECFEALHDLVRAREAAKQDQLPKALHANSQFTHAAPAMQLILSTCARPAE